MITWMQRHKKWLVITIWISTIAFIGAGFVGWGSYDYGKQGSVVATVGDRDISVEEYQQEYSNLYEQYAKMFGSMFTKELAEQLKLKEAALRQVLQRNLLLSYADSLKLDVTDEEIAKELIKYKVFAKDGKFDKDTYVKVLAQNRVTPKSFEEGLKRDLLIQKVQTLFAINPTRTEIENLSKLVFLEDDISMKVLSANDISVTFKDEDLKKYWEENKNLYMSDVSYELAIKEMNLISSNSTAEDIKAQYDKFKSDYKFEDGKIKSIDEAKSEIIQDLDEKLTKTEALKVYIKLKKDEEKFDKTQNFVESKLPFLGENISKITELKDGEVAKPFFENGKYLIVKLNKKVPSTPLSFEDAMKQVKIDYEKTLKETKLQELANSQLKDFKGEQILGVTRESALKLTQLTPQEATRFLNELFSSITKEGIVKLDSKVVLYRINNSKMAQYDKSKDATIENAISKLQEEELMINLLKKLENTYPIKSSIQDKEK